MLVLKTIICQLMQSPRLAIWQQWLLQALFIWAGIELNDALVYWYNVNSSGSYLFNTDGSAVTHWQRFVNHNYYQTVWLVILAGTFIVEYNYHYIFKKKALTYFIAGTCFFSGCFVL